MLPVRVIVLPVLLTPDDLAGRAAVVFDVLRATTSMAAAIDGGAAAIRVFGDLDAAKAAAAAFDGEKFLAGETHAKRPEGFDVGNSPADFTRERCAGHTIFMATTNGTRALVAAKPAAALFTGAIVNAAATAAAVVRAGLPVTLLCSGTEGFLSGEDLVGCGAVLAAGSELSPDNDAARLALLAWQATRGRLVEIFRENRSGHNLRRANLLHDIDDVVTPNRYAVACRVAAEGPELVVRRSAD